MNKLIYEKCVFFTLYTAIYVICVRAIILSLFTLILWCNYKVCLEQICILCALRVMKEFDIISLFLIY